MGKEEIIETLDKEIYEKLSNKSYSYKLNNNINCSYKITDTPLTSYKEWIGELPSPNPKENLVISYINGEFVGELVPKTIFENLEAPLEQDVIYEGYYGDNTTLKNYGSTSIVGDRIYLSTTDDGETIWEKDIKENVDNPTEVDKLLKRKAIFTKNNDGSLTISTSVKFYDEE